MYQICTKNPAFPNLSEIKQGSNGNGLEQLDINVYLGEHQRLGGVSESTYSSPLTGKITYVLMASSEEWFSIATSAVGPTGENQRGNWFFTISQGSTSRNPHLAYIFSSSPTSLSALIQCGPNSYLTKFQVLNLPGFTSNLEKLHREVTKFRPIYLPPPQ